MKDSRGITSKKGAGKEEFLVSNKISPEALRVIHHSKGELV